MPIEEKEFKIESDAIMKQISILKKLNHKNIVKYISSSVSLEEYRIDIILEYFPAGSLKNLLDRYGPLNDKLIRIYARQILEALQFIHSQGIIHMDLKSSNILINNDANIKLSDFGSFLQRRFLNHSKIIHKNFNSLNWMSPEVNYYKGIKAIQLWNSF